MQGITLATARRHGILTKAELRAISAQKVADIYLADYWRFNRLADQRVATKIFDMVVNMGPETAIKLVQNGMNELGACLDVDGHFGRLTEDVINSIRPDQMLALLCMISEEHYRAIVNSKPKQAVFLKGWLRRAAEVPNA